MSSHASDTPVLRTDRLLLRHWDPTDPDDVDFLFDMYARWDVQRFIGRVPRVMESRDEALARAEAWAGHGDVAPFGIWAATRADDGARLGSILLKSIPASGPTEPLAPSGDTEIGWHLHPDAWGHGYASEGAAVVLAAAFGAGLDRVVAVTHPDNAASQAVCRRIGMTSLGLSDTYYNTTCALFEARSMRE
ncbi:GNAT family N-acetyltransferase [Luteimicrobium xylanilyticum]|uniref:[Ribosomal protein S5]-alanine N-acetyltransferase n=1 Tax=Luteimicrobium xylanilyticum TaxID=1133546 RepID=A0A5P9Q830_9MICO|nr:GNAT family N-acetyltransferase [Luteimicrobium xylanilyticum]QFU97581.1 [Ribosomal protein S5]-alanine N-acetyltransferase [Luteimicrobium xylanilyticum]